jgi:hypothetical protein
MSISLKRPQTRESAFKGSVDMTVAVQRQYILELQAEEAFQ